MFGVAVHNTVCQTTDINYFSIFSPPMIDSKLLWISVMTSIALVASTSAENASASLPLLVEEEAAAEAEKVTMMTNQTADGIMTGDPNSTS